MFPLCYYTRFGGLVGTQQLCCQFAAYGVFKVVEQQFGNIGLFVISQFYA